MSRKLLQDLYRVAVARVDPYAMVKNLIRCDDAVLAINTGAETLKFDLRNF